MSDDPLAPQPMTPDEVADLVRRARERATAQRRRAPRAGEVWRQLRTGRRANVIAVESQGVDVPELVRGRFFDNRRNFSRVMPEFVEEFAYEGSRL